MSGLRFNESLSWRAGNPIAIADLLRRLQALAKELRELEQEDIPREAFAKVAKELVSPNLLAHKDKGVKAFVACCLVDILRLCAPDAPYTEQQLKVGNNWPTRVGIGVADRSLGYLQSPDQHHLTFASRPISCLQQPASLRSKFASNGEEHCPSHRPTVLRGAHYKFVCHLL